MGNHYSIKKKNNMRRIIIEESKNKCNESLGIQENNPFYEGEQMRMYAMGNEIFFSLEAVDYIKRLSEILETHAVFREIMNNYEQINMIEFDRVFERQLAMYINVNMGNKVYDERLLVGSYYIINENDVTNIVSILVHEVINDGFGFMLNEDSIQNMIDGYPIKLLSQICNSNMMYANLLGNSMRQFIMLRRTYHNFMPKELQTSTISKYPLINDINSPINNGELEALYRYLGSRRRSYVVMLLNCLFELSDHNKYLRKDFFSIEDISIICQSGWLTLYLLAVDMNRQTHNAVLF